MVKHSIAYKPLQVSLIDHDEANDVYQVEVSVVDSRPHEVAMVVTFTVANADHASAETFVCEAEHVTQVSVRNSEHAIKIKRSAIKAIYDAFDESHETIADVFSDYPAIGFKVR